MICPYPRGEDASTKCSKLCPAIALSGKVTCEVAEGSRTDNAIKNHWNSSVKKKLDSYMASGLLTQLQSVPHDGNPSQSIVATSSRLQCNADDNVLQGTEGDEGLECSHESANALHFPSTREMTSVDLQTVGGECSLGTDHSPSQASCSEPYYISIDDATTCIPEMTHHEACSSELNEQFSHEPGNPINEDCQFNLHSLPNISSIDLGKDSSQLQRDYMESTDPSGIRDSANVSMPMETTSTDAAKPDHMLISDDECCRALFPEANNDRCFIPGDYIKDVDTVEFSGHPPFVCQSCHFQISENCGTSNLPLTCPQCSNNFKGMAYSQSTRPVHSAEPEDQKFVLTAPDNFTYAIDMPSSHCIDATDSAVMRDVKQTCFPTDERPNMHTEKEGKGALCYEPPRFPSMDIPFLSCDLVQSGGDMQQEFSPLGIRQFMMSSMNCLTPSRLWDSPSRDDSPEALLKNAAKTFTGTPSILKKRRRDLLSPLSDKRIGKKLETDMTSSLSKAFSSLEADILSPSSLQKQNSEAPVFDDDKENCGQADKGKQVEEIIKSAVLEEKMSQRDALDSNSPSKVKQQPLDVDSKMKIDVTTAVEIVQQSSGVLSEHDRNDLSLYSSDEVGVRDRVLGSSVISPRNMNNRSSEIAPNQSIPSKIPSENQRSRFSSPCVRAKEHENLTVSIARAKAPEENSGDQSKNDGEFGTCNIFGGTPFRKGFESPSAWKSPWLRNTFLCSPNAEITIEDFGFFKSPGGDRSYDAIGLLKEVGEQTAATYENAQEILNNDTPKALPRGGGTPGDDKNSDDENDDSNNANNSKLTSNALVERRVLDFSECGSPDKSDSSKSSANPQP
ncbi:unnamed protein product [Vicia faba]|uniref:Uncharacterized protein n=1 Tax=Vicia faba TaxID=3906 RepID=A0AAV1A7Z8_VICFA|nr:unnamed protein product [Vicia faba]